MYSQETEGNDWLEGYLGGLGLLGTEEEHKSSLTVKDRSSANTQTLRPTCASSPALDQDQWLWGPVEDEYVRAECEQEGC